MVLGDLYAKSSGAIDPKRFPDEEFDLLSVPAHDRGKPDLEFGRDIGSTKVPVEPGDVLMCKIVPHIRRVWVVPPKRERRQIASGEWIVLRGDQFLRHAKVQSDALVLDIKCICVERLADTDPGLHDPLAVNLSEVVIGH